MMESIPAEGQQVFLRESSNISTGGDSLDFTDTMHPGYKEVARAAAAVAGARICGVDMMIDDYTRAADIDNHAIIELNFNPAIHIHAHPFQGKNRYPECAVLDLLGLE